ncbi:CTP synthase [Leptospira sp. 2 VSF19]|uniref:CTP synthase n=1 Tax=Leptospira soteropolitanensis TaxID=2950025 RepID=A0AAW5VFB3_9LEPT|nr:CTP synthase [Leptospira soteropolitanensis]MCW7492237.1 CTP synthase [Leptospira soteropolitanensis]MCW7499819.1 CTP synthase [Leptospira soteropolitanensis]MCW7522070.1 CTP synthase [Leptospira soteropolitanensis]MCW7525924.1 CTP synthase [Leptospira soteropolitanensis]MCW7529962.1 CTP synthase [Leptospira soteropolitanensis]
MSKTRYIFITGGVSSSLGKGVTVAALGCLLEARGYTVSLQKMDPYINIDPGTMSPYQHGEVYVTEDGAETDLDLGYYERFTKSKFSRKNSVSTGQIYHAVIERERKGDYLGRTVQVVPHITNEIRNRIYNLTRDQETDFVIVEIGGTVGDIESVPFLEAIRQMRYEHGASQVLFLHLTLVPTITAAGEAKTKPTQHSVKELLALGIQPDILICRINKPMSKEMKNKISLFCNVKEQNVISAVDIDTSIYEIPLMYREDKLDEVVLNALGMDLRKLNFSQWENMVKKIRNTKKTVKVALIGKYISLQDAYRSVYESLAHGGIANDVEVNVVKINPEDIDSKNIKELLKGVHGVLVPGGFGERGIEGKIAAIHYARTKQIPFFGICLGMQCAVIEFARNVLGFKDANSTEFKPNVEYPVISMIEEQKEIERMGGTMRLGAYPCILKKGSLAFSEYKAERISERHRHRFEFTLRYKDDFEKKGMYLTGFSPDGSLAEIVEVANHPWFVGVQFHPEFQSKPTDPHPLFAGFIRAASKLAKKTED